MSWVCPNCSNPNDEARAKCLVCGMDRPAAGAKVASEEEGKIVFSDLEAFSLSVKDFFRPRPVKEKPVKEKAVKEMPAKESRERPRPEPKPVRAETPKAAKEEKPKKSLLSGGDFAKPWPEHKIKFDVSVIKTKGYVRSEQTCLGGVNGYSFYKEDGSSQFIRVEMLITQKMAHKI